MFIYNSREMENIEIKDLTKISEAAETFIKSIGESKVFAFQGEMGAGKTTFIKAICQTLGVVDNITSPTFALVNDYNTPNDGHIYHFDCYRLRSQAEAYDFGAEEYFYSGNFCFIEWPDKIDGLLPDDTVWVNIAVKEDGSREVSFL